jgi:outer membrane protein assembly factor BamB
MGERLGNDPNNAELLHEIRMFDLMARKAYFTSKWQVQTGGLLLLIGAIVLVVSLRYYFSATSKIDEPEENKTSQYAARILSQKWLLGMAAVLIASAIAASFLSVDNLKRYSLQIAADAQAQEVGATLEQSIEVVDLTSNKTDEDSGLIEQSKAVVAVESASVETSENKHVADDKFPSLSEMRKHYNSFRGPLGHGVSPHKAPTSWDGAAGTNVKWKVKIPVSGYSSPILWGNKLFITGANNNDRWLYCYDTGTGKLLWQHQANGIAGSPATAPKTTDDTGLAAPTAVTDGRVVVAIFGTGDIMACDLDGNRVWARNLGVPDNHYGHSSSLIAWANKVLVQYDTNRGGRLLALDMMTGEIKWDIRRTSRISWASPILAEIGGKMQVITAAEPTVAGYDIETGKELWKNDCLMGEIGPSPAFGSGLVFATNEYATLAAINPENGSKVWEENEYLAEVASPVVADGLLFVATSYGVLACYDVHTGNKYWEKDFGQGFYASPVIAGDLLYAADMSGSVHIYKVSRQAEPVASPKMGEKVYSTPAFGEGRIYVRGVGHLYCIGK